MVLVAAISITTAFYVWRGQSLQHSRVEAFAFICLYCLSLGLALRFGGRTYPGIYFPNSAFLNGLLNGNGLFVDIGYSAVMVAGAADTLLVFTRTRRRGLTIALKGVKWIAASLAMVIALYGFYWAATLQRIP
jgi:hypothetical protein